MISSRVYRLCRLFVLVFRAVNSLTDIGYNVSLSINKNRFPLCPNLQRPLT